MIWVFRQSLNPLLYLSIRQGTGIFKSKITIDWVVPSLFSVLTTLMLLILPFDIDYFGSDGLVTRFLDLLQLMSAFFIAALAAVATFERKGLDDKMKGEPATIMRYRKSSQSFVEHILSRREFICYLFGYLSFVSISLFIFLNFGRVIIPNLYPLVNTAFPIIIQICEVSALLLFFLILWQLIFAMFMGIYFLSDRLQVMNDPDI